MPTSWIQSESREIGASDMPRSEWRSLAQKLPVFPKTQRSVTSIRHARCMTVL